MHRIVISKLSSGPVLSNGVLQGTAKAVSVDKVFLADHTGACVLTGLPCLHDIVLGSRYGFVLNSECMLKAGTTMVVTLRNGIAINLLEKQTAAPEETDRKIADDISDAWTVGTMITFASSYCVTSSGSVWKKILCFNDKGIVAITLWNHACEIPNNGDAIFANVQVRRPSQDNTMLRIELHCDANHNGIVITQPNLTEQNICFAERVDAKSQSCATEEIPFPRGLPSNNNVNIQDVTVLDVRQRSYASKVHQGTTSMMWIAELRIGQSPVPIRFTVFDDRLAPQLVQGAHLDIVCAKLTLYERTREWQYVASCCTLLLPRDNAFPTQTHVLAAPVAPDPLECMTTPLRPKRERSEDSCLSAPSASPSPQKAPSPQKLPEAIFFSLRPDDELDE